MRSSRIALLLFVLLLSAAAPALAGESSSPLQRSWQRLISGSACLLGREYCHTDKKGKTICSLDLPEISPKRDGSPFRKAAWRRFLSADRARLYHLLLRRIPSTKPSRLHVCPFDTAIEGELAVYCLQQLLRVNWVDLSPRYRKHLKRSAKGKSLQSALQRIIRSKREVRRLTALWEKRVARQKASPKGK